ncbi:MAG: DNA polymerase III subunit gamma/tau [Magnetococcales bacterium]|nr:DNA polymerase III subunit gamma/tau [Magnetococcales bacterium]
MSNYVVLARRWRPRSFDTLIGQNHVTRALVNALDSGRLSHAFLFSGIRGTGKTTLARLLALCLNCEKGTTSTPCGQCGSCTEIIAGNHPDVLEIDAASRTKVEQMRELLDMVAYAPSRSRFRIFILDEVHMLSVPSFNALLKTLEEPPEHVKFLFATTELRKLPATILSRCQRYELKRVPEEMLADHMERILLHEGIQFESNALRLVAQAAEGSVRDSLSLLDQVISHGNGVVAHETVRQLLGLTQNETILTLLKQILSGDGKNLLETLSDIHRMGVEPESVVRDLLTRVHAEVRIKVARDKLPDTSNPDSAFLSPVSLEHLQMVYMVLNKGGNELRQTAHPWHAMEMLMLRVCYLAPVPDLDKLIRVLGNSQAQGGSNAPPTPPVNPSLHRPDSSQAAPLLSASRPFPVKNDRFPDNWAQLIAHARTTHPPLAMKLGAQLACLRYQPPAGERSGIIELQLINDCFGTPESIGDSISEFLDQNFQQKVKVIVHSSASQDRPETLQERHLREQEESASQLEKEIGRHPGVLALRTRFNAEVISITPPANGHNHQPYGELH